MSRKSQITMTSRADAAKTRNVALLRRLESGQVFRNRAQDVPLKEPQRWQTHVANTYINDSRFLEMKEKGWVPLMPEDLACPVAESGFSLSPDGYLVKGPQGKEMIFKMDKADYAALEQAKTAANLRGIGSASKVKADIAEAASGQLGDEAATYISKLPGQVVDTITGGDAA